LVLAAAERRGASPGEVGHFDHAKRVRDAIGNFIFGRGLDAQAVGDIVADIQMGKEGVVLEDGVDATPVRRQRVEALAGHPDLAGAGLFETGDEAEKRGLAGTALAEQSKKFPAGDLQRDIPEHFGAAETLGDPADFKKCRRRRSF